MTDKQAKIMEFNEDDAVTVTSDNIVWWKGERPGDKIVGYYIGENEGDMGKSYILRYDDIDHGLPSHKLLNEAMEKIPLHSVVKVVFEGEAETKDGKRKYAKYTVKAIPPPPTP